MNTGDLPSVRGWNLPNSPHPSAHCVPVVPGRWPVSSSLPSLCFSFFL